MNLEKTVTSLKKAGYSVSVFPDKAAADRYLNEVIDSRTVGIGGSMTIEEMGTFDTLSAHNQVFWHWHPAEGMTPDQARDAAAQTEIYLTSANAISEEGEIVNVDGYGNRLASSLCGHEKVYFIAGINKIAADLYRAVDRAKDIASPMNAKRLKCKTPCAVTGEQCFECSSPERICNAMVIHFRKMQSCEMEVVLIKENLGY